MLRNRVNTVPSVRKIELSRENFCSGEPKMINFSTCRSSLEGCGRINQHFLRENIIMHRVEQRNFESGDCGIACVAMVTCESYEVVEREFRDNGLISEGNYFTFHKDLISVLKHFGYEVRRRKFVSWGKVDFPAIVKINPRTGNYWHWVVLAGERKMFDPKPGSPAVVTDFRGRKGSGYYLQVLPPNYSLNTQASPAGTPQAAPVS